MEAENSVWTAGVVPDLQVDPTGLNSDLMFPAA